MEDRSQPCRFGQDGQESEHNLSGRLGPVTSRLAKDEDQRRSAMEGAAFLESLTRPDADKVVNRGLDLFPEVENQRSGISANIESFEPIETNAVEKFPDFRVGDDNDIKVGGLHRQLVNGPDKAVKRGRIDGLCAEVPEGKSTGDEVFDLRGFRKRRTIDASRETPVPRQGALRAARHALSAGDAGRSVKIQA
ncbi:MAG TPA: hypothetical protein VLJ16_09160 [Acidobacteriota bacterium]|nr:hypothetical protein [Acidobacteriota bacterium]